MPYLPHSALAPRLGQTTAVQARMVRRLVSEVKAAASVPGTRAGSEPSYVHGPAPGRHLYQPLGLLAVMLWAQTVSFRYRDSANSATYQTGLKCQWQVKRSRAWCLSYPDARQRTGQTDFSARPPSLLGPLRPQAQAAHLAFHRAAGAPSCAFVP